jgi:hypothetical protein
MFAEVANGVNELIGDSEKNPLVLNSQFSIPIR